MATNTHIYCEATQAHAWVPPKSVATWARHGWAAVSDLPVEDEDSAAEADKAEHGSRGKSSARTTKDK